MNVCAIILDYFGAKKTETCLLSLTNQGIRTIYLLDNSGSRDISLDLTRAIDRVRSSGVDYNVEVLSAGKNLGFSRGVNFVLAHDRRSGSPHDHYLLLNNDAVAGPSLVNGLIVTLKENPGAALVAPRTISISGSEEEGVWYHRYLGLLLSSPRNLSFYYLPGCCLFFHRELVGEKGLFDEAFFMYGEDAELGWRLAREGHRMVCAPDVLVRHEAGASSHKGGLFYEYHMVRGHILLALRTWRHPAEIPLIVSAKLLALLFRALIRCLRYRSLVPITAFFLACFPLKRGRGFNDLPIHVWK